MSHLSSRKVNREVLEKIHNLFFSAITSKRVSRKHQQAFFDELLTPTEKTMLAKRLTAITLLNKKLTPYKVSNILQLSETTTNKLLLKLDSGKFQHIIKTQTTEGRSALGNYIENLISPPPKYGKSFIKHLEDTY